MSNYITTSGVLDQIGAGATKVAGAITQYNAIKAAASAPATAAPVDEGFNWTPILLIGGIGIAAYFLLRKKK